MRRVPSQSEMNFLQEFRMRVLDVVDVQHHVLAHLQREVEFFQLLPRGRVRRLRRIQ